MGEVRVEHLGGFAGFGGPHLKSRGELAVSDLSPVDRQAVEALFNDPQKAVPAPVNITARTFRS